MHDIVVTGAGSGLGRALHERFGGLAVTRATDLAEIGAAGTIIHCAVNTRARTAGGTLGRWVEDNVILTRRMLEVPHDRFVYLSSIDVYPEGPGPHAEGVEVDLATATTPYAAAKIMGEAMVLDHGVQPLVLRASALLGPHARPNSLVRMLTTPDCRLGLSPDSTFNYVHHDAVGDVIDVQDAQGVLNVCSTGVVRLGDIAAAHAPGTRFGEFTYSTPAIDNTRAATLVPALRRTSAEVVADLIAVLPAVEGPDEEM